MREILNVGADLVRGLVRAQLGLFEPHEGMKHFFDLCVGDRSALRRDHDEPLQLAGRRPDLVEPEQTGGSRKAMHLCSQFFSLCGRPIPGTEGFHPLSDDRNPPGKGGPETAPQLVQTAVERRIGG